MSRGVRQLDLSNCGPGLEGSIVPGLRSGATFFSFLGANLVLTPSAVSSASNTPSLEPYRLLPPSPPPPPSLSPPRVRSRLRPRSPPPAPLDDIPPLSLDTLTSRHEKAEGLCLVADSVAQMSARAAAALARHPVCLAVLAAAWAAAYRLAAAADTAAPVLAAAAAAAAAYLAAYLAAVRLATRGYRALARDIDADWLRAAGRDDVILGARCGDALVGALVLRLEPPRSRRKNLGRGVIRAWTTRLSHRRRGIGRHLLLAAVRKTKERCGRDAQVGFATEHANSVMLLPGPFAAPFRRDEVRAARALDDAAAEWELGRKRKR